MDKTHYEAMRAKIEAEYRANIAALERVMALDESLFPSNAVTNVLPIIHATEIIRTVPQTRTISDVELDILLSVDSDASHRNGDKVVPRGAIAAAILQAAPDLGVFKVADLIERIRSLSLLDDVRESSVQQALKRLVEDGQIALVTKGTGRAPSYYRFSIDDADDDTHSEETNIDDI